MLSKYSALGDLKHMVFPSRHLQDSYSCTKTLNSPRDTKQSSGSND